MQVHGGVNFLSIAPRRITVAGSYFLMPGNAAWRPLQEQGTVFFEAYGNWMQALAPTADGHDDVVLLVLVVEDIVGAEHLSQLEPLRPESRDDWFAGHFAPLLAGLSSRLERSTVPTIVLCASVSSAASIENLRCETVMVAALSWLGRAGSSLQEGHGQLYWVNDYHLTSDVGRLRLFDQRNWFFASCRWSQTGLSHLATTSAAVLERLNRPRAKLLVLDCDNTIWGGVIGEDGLNGILLGEDGYGRIYVEFQGVAKALTQKGILVALCSKNAPEDVWQVFDSHSSMVLTRKDIVAAEISWDSKSEGLKRLSKQLDIGLDSVVFWDDNPIERAQVREDCPEVLVVEPPKESWEWPNALRNLRALQNISITPDDRQKQEQYKSRAKFHQGLKSSADPNAFLRSLEMKATLTRLDESLVARAEQMCQKTNQFNLRTARHRAVELRAIDSNGGAVWIASLKDRYGDHGNTALIAASRAAKNLWFLDTYLMSCRVLGRRFEWWVLDRVAQEVLALGGTEMLVEYIPTPRNGPAKDWVAGLGLSPVEAARIAAFEHLVGRSIVGELYLLMLAERPTVAEGLFG